MHPSAGLRGIQFSILNVLESLIKKDQNKIGVRNKVWALCDNYIIL